MPDKKAFEVVVLKDFGNYKVMKEIVFISEQKPSAADLNLKETDLVLRIRESSSEVIIK